MRSTPHALWLFASASAIGLAAPVTPVRAACTYNSIPAPSGVFALSSDGCTAAPGTYATTFEPDVALPVPYTGFAFFASNEDAEGTVHAPGVINAKGAVTILTNTGEAIYDNAYGAWSQGAGSQINFGGAATITTAGAFSAGLFADGGAITATGPVAITTTGADANGVTADAGGKVTLSGGTVTTSGAGSFGLTAFGAGSQITANNIAALNTGTGVPTGAASAVFVDTGGVVTMNGGSANSTGVSGLGVGIGNGVVNLNGTTLVETGLGAGGIALNGTTGALNATGITITTHGDKDPVTGFTGFGIFNGPFRAFDGGGTAAVSNSTITTTGSGAVGVETRNGGKTIFTGGSITTSGAQSDAVLALSTAQVNVQGTTISTSGNAAKGLDVQGVGTTLTASNLNVTTTGTVNPATGNHAQGLYNGNASGVGDTGGGFATVTNSTFLTKGYDSVGIETLNGGVTTVSGGSVATTGATSTGVVSDSAASVTLNGTAVSTTGDGAKGLVVNGGGTLNANNATITTSGGLDAASGLVAAGAYNGTSSTFATGGVLKLSDTSVLTGGFEGNAVITRKGTTTVSGGSYSSSGALADVILGQGSGTRVSVSGAIIASTGLGSPGAALVGSGSSMSLSDDRITTSGDRYEAGRNAVGVYNGTSADGKYVGGGAMTVTNSTITTRGSYAIGVVTADGGTTSITGGSIATLGANAFGVNADGAGSKVNLASTAITTSGAGAIGLFASDRASSGAAGTIAATGPLDIQTKSASAAAVALQGNGATIAATGGGTITAAGNAIEFLGGTGQSATFDNFKIGALSGDLVFADPSVATLNFNNTIANAGAGNLLDATAGSAIALNANASMLTGAIVTDAASITNVNLTNGTAWNLTGSSTVTNLSLAHSVIVFAPPGAGSAFKTLTVTNYVGNGANIAMNVALGGSGSAGDRIIINGGKATGSTLLTINNVGGRGGQTSGNGIPIVMATNGGAIAVNAFSLANIPIAGGFRYTLDQSGDNWFLVSSPTATVAGLTSSINSVARAQQSQMITNRVLGSLLLGATQQISCSSCGGGFASIGSFALGGSGRWRLSDNLTLLGGVSYNQWSASGITVYNAPTVAGALIYDFVNWGRSRPFLEVGAGLTPYEQVNYSRVYPNGLTTGYGYASAIDRQASLFGRAGWVDRLTPIDEAAAYVDLGRSWMQTGGYSEQMTAINPFPATVPNGLATLNTARFGAQYTHLFNGNIEANVGAAVAYGFGSGSGASFNILEFGTLAPGAIGGSAWFEYGARLGYRVTDRMVVDAFVLGTAGGLAGNFVHGGFGVRLAF